MNLNACVCLTGDINGLHWFELSASSNQDRSVSGWQKPLRRSRCYRYYIIYICRVSLHKQTLLKHCISVHIFLSSMTV